MVDPEIVIIPVVFLIPSAVIGLRMWLRHKETMAGLSANAPGSNLDARLDRIEAAVEAIAVEMERVGEGQRFVTKLLAQRDALPARNGEAPRDAPLSPR